MKVFTLTMNITHTSLFLCLITLINLGHLQAAHNNTMQVRSRAQQERAEIAQELFEDKPNHLNPVITWDYSDVMQGLKTRRNHLAFDRDRTKELVFLDGYVCTVGSLLCCSALGAFIGHYCFGSAETGGQLGALAGTGTAITRCCTVSRPYMQQIECDYNMERDQTESALNHYTKEQRDQKKKCTYSLLYQ